MNKQAIEVLAHKTAKNLKTEKDLSSFSRIFKKTAVEVVLTADCRRSRP